MRASSLALLVAEGERLEHLLLGDLLARPTRPSGRASSVPAITSSSGEAACWLVGRVGDELAVDQAHPDRADRAVERDAGQAQRGRGAVHGEHVGIVLVVAGDDQADDLDLVAEALGEQRPDAAGR